jgi:homoserine dehydrogenase
MNDEGLSYEKALDLAQQLGFAESNPTLDVGGFDAANKLTILLAHAYGISTLPGKLLFKGITQLHADDARFASEKDFTIKLTAQARKLSSGKIAAFVLPQFVTKESQLFNVKNEFNGVIIETKLADKQFLYGKGAGRYPTSSAVISDISALRYHYKYEYKKLTAEDKPALTNDYYLRVYVSFENWEKISKWDFESIETYHSTEDRQYVTGLIHVEKLLMASWLSDPYTSVIVLPNGIVEKETIVLRSLKKVSLQLGGVY